MKRLFCAASVALVCAAGLCILGAWALATLAEPGSEPG